MLLGSGLMFLGSLTANHPSNHQVIQAAYLRSNMAEEKLFEEMNISDSENSGSSNNTHSNIDSASGSEMLLHRDKSPSFDWSHLASGTTTPASDKTKRSHHSDMDISRTDCNQKPSVNATHSPVKGYGPNKTKTVAYTSSPPCYDATQDLIWMKRIEDPVEGSSTSNGESDVTAIHVSTPKTQIRSQQMTSVPAKTTYV